MIITDDDDDDTAEANGSSSAPKQNIKIPCFKCNQVFLMDDFLVHQASHITNPSNETALSEIKCSECGMSFDTVKNLINHMKVLHFSMWGMWNQYYNFASMGQSAEQYSYSFMQFPQQDSFESVSLRRWASNKEVHGRRRPPSPPRRRGRHHHHHHGHVGYHHHQRGNHMRGRMRRGSSFRSRLKSEERRFARRRRSPERPRDGDRRDSSPILIEDSDEDSLRFSGDEWFVADSCEGITDSDDEDLRELLITLVDNSFSEDDQESAEENNDKQIADDNDNEGSEKTNNNKLQTERACQGYVEKNVNKQAAAIMNPSQTEKASQGTNNDKHLTRAPQEDEALDTLQAKILPEGDQCLNAEEAKTKDTSKVEHECDDPLLTKIQRNTGDGFYYECRRFGCSNCGEVFTNFDTFNRHIITMPKSHQFTCILCSTKTFLFLSELLRHVNLQHTPTFYTQKEKHYYENDGKPWQTYYCNFCDHKYYLLRDFEAHKLQHIDWQLECSSCARKFKDIWLVFKHFQNQHALINNVDLLCKKCGVHFYTPQIYAKHMENFHSILPTDYSFQCVLCDNNFEKMEAFCLHVHKHGIFYEEKPDVVAENDRPMFHVLNMQCEICGLIIEKKGSIMKKHMKGHLVREICYICKQHVPLKVSAEHRVKFHNELSLIVNKWDGKGEGTRQPEKSKRGIAEYPKLASCYTCFAFVDKMFLADHVLEHEINGTNVCNKPQTKFGKARNTIFIKCKLCKLSFSQQFLQNHMKVHKDERAFRRHLGFDSLEVDDGGSSNQTKRSRRTKRSESYWNQYHSKKRETNTRYENMSIDYDSDEEVDSSTPYSNERKRYRAEDDLFDEKSRCIVDVNARGSFSEQQNDLGEAHRESYFHHSREDSPRYSRKEDRYRSTSQCDTRSDLHLSRDNSSDRDYTRSSKRDRYDDDDDRYHHKKSQRRRSKSRSRERIVEVVCPKCNILITKEHFQVHLATHQSKIKCPDCQLEFDTVDNMVNHLKVVHLPSTSSMQVAWPGFPQFPNPYFAYQSPEMAGHSNMVGQNNMNSFWYSMQQYKIQNQHQDKK